MKTKCEIEWKPVADGLPEEHNDVLISIKGSPHPVQIGFYHKSRWFYADAYLVSREFGYTVTHWAHKPEPAK